MSQRRNKMALETDSALAIPKQALALDKVANPKFYSQHQEATALRRICDRVYYA